MVRILNILLLLVTLVGVLFVWQARSAFDVTRREHQRLAARVGRLPIEDESKAHVIALETDDPLDLVWIIYLPAKFNAKWESVVYQSGSSSTSGGDNEARTEIVRVRFRKIDGQWHLWRKFINSSSTHSINDYFRMKSETERMLAEHESLRRLARELVIDDPAQYAVVERHEQWHGEDVWDVHLPEAHRYVLKLSTRHVGPRNFPETEYVTTLPAGRHVISLEKSLTKERASAKVIVDDASVIEVPAVDDWFPGDGYGWGGTHTQATQSPTDKPLELIRIRFHKKRDDGSSRSSDEPYNGLFLWIERDS